MEIMLSARKGIENSNLLPYRRYLEQAVQQLDVTLNSLKLNHPSITQQDMDKIKRYISNSLQAQDFYDEQKCMEENKPNPYKVSKIKTGGASRKMMEFVTSGRHAIGIYKRCVYEIEGMQSAVAKMEKRASFQNHHKLLDLQSYTKHYERFKKDLKMLSDFEDLEGRLEKEFKSSRDVEGKREWENNLKAWKTPGYIETPAQVQEHYSIHP